MLWSLPVVPLVTGLAVWAIQPATAGRRRPPIGRLGLGESAAAAIAATLALGIWAAVARPTAGMRWSALISLQLGVDDTAAVMAVLAPAVALPVVVFAAAHEARGGLERLLGLLIAFVGGMELLVVAEDLLTLLIGWELVGLVSWALIAHEWRRLANTQAAAHAFVTTRFGDLGLFAALGAALAGAGSMRYDDLGAVSGGWRDLLAAGIVVAAASKSAQLPFSPWLFSAMVGPSAVSALLHSATMVAAGAFVLIRLHPVLTEVGWFGPVLVTVGLTTALVAGAVAVGQADGKRLLAASTSAQYGLMVVAVGVGAPSAALAHLVVHAGFKALLFLAAGIALGVCGTNELVRQRLGTTLPRIAVAALIGAAALAAVPPLGGAWSKELIVGAAGEDSDALALLVVVAGGLSATYATVWFLLAYGPRRRPSEVDLAHRPRVFEGAALTALATISVIAGIGWLPAGRRLAEDVLGSPLPDGAAWELVASLATIAAGVAMGALIAARARAADVGGAVAVARGWVGIPAVTRRVLVDPTLAVARWAARFDDLVVDAGSRAVAVIGRAASRLAAAGDDRVVDGGVRATAAVGRLLARVLSTDAEAGVDGAVDGLAGATRRGGRLARRLQTGLSHQYYVIAAVGLVALVLVAALGT